MVETKYMSIIIDYYWFIIDWSNVNEMLKSIYSYTRFERNAFEDKILSIHGRTEKKGNFVKNVIHTRQEHSFPLQPSTGLLNKLNDSQGFWVSGEKITIWRIVVSINHFLDEYLSTSFPPKFVLKQTLSVNLVYELKIL